MGSNKRAEQRRLEKHGDVFGVRPTMTPEVAVDWCSTAFIYSMSDCDVPNEVIKEVLKKVNLTMDCLISGNLSLCDLKNMCLEQTGINIHRK